MEIPFEDAEPTEAESATRAAETGTQPESTEADQTSTNPSRPVKACVVRLAGKGWGWFNRAPGRKSP